MVKDCLYRIGLGLAALVFLGFQPAAAACQLIHATHSARSHAKAVETSRMLALHSAYDLQRSMGWSRITMTAHWCRENRSGRRFVRKEFQRTQGLGPTS